jgi:hypothetical protein
MTAIGMAAHRGQETQAIDATTLEDEYQDVVIVFVLGEGEPWGQAGGGCRHTGCLEKMAPFK